MSKTLRLRRAEPGRGSVRLVLLAFGLLFAALLGCERGDSDAPGAAGDASAAPTAEQRALAYYRRGQALRRSGRFAEAIEQFRKGVRIGPYNEWACYELGHLLVAHAPLDEVEAYYRAALPDDPKPQTSHFFWGRALARAGRTEDSLVHFEEALRIDPAHEMSHNAWGEVLASAGRLEEAAARFREALRVHPEYPEAHRNLARVLDALGRTEEADEHRYLATQGSLESERRFLYWGRARLRAGHTEEAERLLRKALAVESTREEARALLDEARAGPGADAPVATP